MDRHHFRQWLCGIYGEYAYDKFDDAIEYENARKIKRFSHEVLAFMDKHDIINPRIK